MQIVLQKEMIRWWGPTKPMKMEMWRLLESEVDQKPNNRGQMLQKQFIQKMKIMFSSLSLDISENTAYQFDSE